MKFDDRSIMGQELRPSSTVRRKLVFGQANSRLKRFQLKLHTLPANLVEFVPVETYVGLEAFNGVQTRKKRKSQGRG